MFVYNRLLSLTAHDRPTKMQSRHRMLVLIILTFLHRIGFAVSVWCSEGFCFQESGVACNGTPSLWNLYHERWPLNCHQSSPSPLCRVIYSTGSITLHRLWHWEVGEGFVTVFIGLHHPVFNLQLSPSLPSHLLAPTLSPYSNLSKKHHDTIFCMTSILEK